MEPRIFEDKQNDLMNRREVRIEVENNFVPSRIEAIHIVSELCKCPIDVIKINRVDSQFGTNIFTIVADIYKSKEDRSSTALKKKKDSEMERKFEEKAKLKEKPVENSQEIKEVPEQDLETKEETPGQEEKIE